jgi:hypothetical protein
VRQPCAPLASPACPLIVSNSHSSIAWQVEHGAGCRRDCGSQPRQDSGAGLSRCPHGRCKQRLCTSRSPPDVSWRAHRIAAPRQGSGPSREAVARNGGRVPLLFGLCRVVLVYSTLFCGHPFFQYLTPKQIAINISFALSTFPCVALLAESCPQLHHVCKPSRPVHHNLQSFRFNKWLRLLLSFH